MEHIETTPSIAVLGTGLIGAAIARNLLRKGFKVRAWNRTAEKTAPLEADGALTCRTAAEAVQGAGIIVTVLKDGTAVEETMVAALPSISAGAVWLQLSTIGVASSDKITNFAAENNLTLYDAPVQGTRQPAEMGKLVILASGPKGQREVAQSVFDAIGQRTLWVSDMVGASSRLKLALNSFVFSLTHGTAEALSVAKALGIDPSVVVDAITDGPLDSGYFQGKASAMIKGDYSTSFSVENGLKDAELVVEALLNTGLRTEFVDASLSRFKRAAQAGHKERDIAASFLV